MVISDQKVVTIDYTLTDDNDSVIDTSKGRKPLQYLHGVGALIPGLENELNGKSAGAELKVTVEPALGYGLRSEDLMVVVARSSFQENAELVVGLPVQIMTQEGEKIGAIYKIEEEEVTIDLNHALAGQNLHFDVHIIDVREATEKEIADGKAHP